MFLSAVIAASVSGLADARDTRERAIEHADEMADADRIRGSFEVIAPFLSLSALQGAVVA